MTAGESRAYGPAVVSDQRYVRRTREHPLPRLPVVMRQRRLELGHTQADVAHFLGVTQGAVGRWEKGSRVPEGDLLLQLLRFLGLTPKQVS